MLKSTGANKVSTLNSVGRRRSVLGPELAFKHMYLLNSAQAVLLFSHLGTSTLLFRSAQRHAALLTRAAVTAGTNVPEAPAATAFFIVRMKAVNMLAQDRPGTDWQ